MSIASVWKPNLTITTPPVDALYTNAAPGVLLDVTAGSFALRRLPSGSIGSLAVSNRDEPTYATKSARIRLWGTNIGAACKVNGMLGFWIYFDQLEVVDNGLALMDIKSYAGGGAPANDDDTTAADRTYMVRMYLKNHSGAIKLGTSIFRSGGSVVEEKLYTVLPKTWYYIQVLWFSLGSGIYRYIFNIKPRGGEFVEFNDHTTSASVLVPYLCSIHWGLIPTAGTVYRKGGPARIYGMELYSVTAVTDAGTYPSIADPEPPAATAMDWYWEASGSDTDGDGSLAHPWKSETRLLNALWDGTILSNHRILLGTSGTAWDATSEAKAFKVLSGYDGVSILLGRINLLHTITSEWTNTSGHVWQTATGDTTRFAWAVLLQDYKWMAKINSADAAGAMSELESTPGSFYTDGTNWYVHPFNSDDPNNYTWQSTVCRGFSGTLGGHFFASSGTNTTFKTYTGFENVVYGPTVIAKPSDGDNSVAYLFAFVESGTGKAENIKVAGYGKHAIASTTVGSNKGLYYHNITILSGGNYCTPGGQTPFVDYNDGSGVTNNCMFYYKCNVLGNVIVYGARWDSIGDLDGAFTTWLSHGTDGSNEQITFLDCDFGGSALTAGNGENITVLKCRNIGTLTCEGVLTMDQSTDIESIEGSPALTHVIPNDIVLDRDIPQGLSFDLSRSLI